MLAGYLYKNNPYPSRKPLTVVILFLAPSCSSSSPLPRVFGCFSAWQEAQIRGLKLDQIFNRYRFLWVPGFPTSSTQLSSILPLFSLNLSLSLSRLQSQTNLRAAHSHSHARMHTGNHKVMSSGREVQLIFSLLPLPSVVSSLLSISLSASRSLSIFLSLGLSLTLPL